MEEIKFSILVPTYKDKFLKECIDSILSQTYTEFEIIIINDASPYDIDSIVCQYNDSHIRYFKKAIGSGAENVVDNWNKCLSYAIGNYVICMGDDDMLLPDCLEKFNNHISSNPNFDIYHIRTEVINENGDIISLQEARPQQESVYSLIWHKINNKRIQFIGDFCFKTETLKRNGGFYKLPYACYSDDISVYISSREKGIYNINDLGFRYRENSQTITNTQNYRETIISVEKAAKVMNSFLSSSAQNDDDEKYRILSLKKLTQYKLGVCYYCIQEDIKKNPIAGFRFWRKRYSLNGLSQRMFYRLIINSIIYKIKRLNLC